MGDRAVIAAAKDEGLRPGEGIRAALDGPSQAEFFEFDQDAAVVDEQLGRRPVAWGGRKRGAKGRATKDVIEYIRRTGTDPLMWMSKIASMSPTEMVEFTGMQRADALEYQRKIVSDLKSTLYPGSTIADLLKDALGDEGLLQVTGFLALAKAQPGDHGSALPDRVGQQSEPALRRPVKLEENQPVSDPDGSGVAQTQGRTNAPCD